LIHVVPEWPFGRSTPAWTEEHEDWIAFAAEQRLAGLAESRAFGLSFSLDGEEVGGLDLHQPDGKG
ncbi:MAG TPA: hypothetical protein VIR81_07585, partial [Myxococcales bacterium]